MNQTIWKKVGRTRVIMSKECPRCGKVKPRNEFIQNIYGYIGDICLECKARRRNHPRKGGRKHIPHLVLLPYSKCMGDPDRIMDFLRNHIGRNDWSNVISTDREKIIQNVLFLSDLRLVEGRADYQELMELLKAVPYTVSGNNDGDDLWED